MNISFIVSLFYDIINIIFEFVQFGLEEINVNGDGIMLERIGD